MDGPNISKTLNDFMLATLISEGQWDIDTPSILKTPFSKEKSLYLAELLKENNLGKYVHVNLRKEQIEIQLPEGIEELYKKQWFNEKLKIFSRKPSPNLLTFSSLVLCINLYGERKLEWITIPTNVEKKYIKTLAYCIEKHLNVPVVPGTNHIKISNITTLITNILQVSSTVHSAEMINYLTNKERQTITEGEIVYES